MYAIQYFPQWVKNGVALSPLHLPLQIPPRSFPNLSRETWYGLPPEIADSMPDAFGNAIIDAELARRGAGIGEVSPLDRLAYVGSRAMGALEFRPAIGPESPIPTLLEIGELVGVARDVVSGNLSISAESQKALKQILAVGTSAGGARAKAVVNIDEKTGEISAGQLP
jgi:serine/threonine-protein kinase HipA